MPSSTVNICVLTLVLLSFQQTCHSRPHRSERGLVKDYFVPDSHLFSADEFEKGEDGKYYLKKNAHRSDSEVKYSSPEDGKNSLENAEKSTESESAIVKSEKIQSESIKNEPLKEEVIKVSDVAPIPTIVKEQKVTEETKNPPKIDPVVEEIAKEVKVKSEKAPFSPVDPKFEMQPKPDSKDEIYVKTNLPPIDSEEKVDEKITIGQVPDLYSRLVPVPGTFRVPIMIPLRHVTYESVKVMPIPPAEMSDRLPLPYEDDIIGEGAHESESEVASQPISEEKKDGAHSLGNPLTKEVRLPALSIGTFLKDIKEADKRNSEKQTKVVDVLGKKFLMQSNVVKYPTGDNSNIYLRFLSVKPLEEPKPIVPKEIAAEEASRKELEKEDQKVVAKEVTEKEKSMIESETEKEKSLVEFEVKKEKELLKEPEVLKAEETKLKINVQQEVPKEVILRNMGEKSFGDTIDEMKMHKIEHSVLETAELGPIEKTEEKVIESIEKTRSEVEEMKPDSLLKEEIVDERNDEEEEEKVISEETKDKEVEVTGDLLKKEDAKIETEIANKKDFFFVEKKKKGFMEESEKVKSSKKAHKKKKCKCEEKDSDSEDDDE